MNRYLQESLKRHVGVNASHPLDASATSKGRTYLKLHDLGRLLDTVVHAKVLAIRDDDEDAVICATR